MQAQALPQAEELRRDLIHAIHADDMSTILEYFNDSFPGHREIFDNVLHESCNDAYLWEGFEAGLISPYSCMLLWAADSGATTLGAWLVMEQGADIHVRNRGGRTPLINALAEHHDQFVELLLELQNATSNIPFTDYYDEQDFDGIEDMLSGSIEGEALLQFLRVKGWPV